jgi:hypothetical protein
MLFLKIRKKLLTILLQRNDQTLEFNPTNLNIIGTELTNGSEVYAVYFDSTWNRKENFYHLKHKISTIKRQFYTHHRKSLRKLAYSYYRTKVRPIYAWAKSSRYTSNITVRSDVANNLQIYQRYSRMIQNQTFGWHLLNFLSKNAFWSRNTNYFNQMQVNKLQFGQSNYKLDQIS